MSEQHVTIGSTGVSTPVFLCSEVERSQLYVDMDEGSKVQLEFSYDEEDRVKKGGRFCEWLIPPCGLLTSDFAMDLVGPPTAVRLRVREAKGKIHLRVIQNGDKKGI